MARAKCVQKLNELLVSVLNLAQIYDLFDDIWGYLHFEQFLIIVDQGDNAVLCANVVHKICTHGMVKEQVDPLRHVQLVLVAPVANQLY